MRGTSKRDEEGGTTKCKIVKNKLAPPYKDCEIRIVYGKGIDGADETFGIAVEMDIIKKSGAWFVMPALDCKGLASVGDDLTNLKFHGEENAKIFIDQTDGYFEALSSAIATASRIVPAQVPDLVEVI
jgi:hypothetical protein